MTSMMFWPCLALASGGAPVKMESSQTQLGSFLERCHLCKKWIGDNDVYILCDAGTNDVDDVLAMFGSGERWCSGENGELSDTAWEFLGKMPSLQKGPNHVLPKLPNLAPAPLAIPDIPTIESSQYIPPLPQSSDHRGSKRLFHIDAKLFSFSFDGGMSDLYAIHETCRDVKSSIWVGHRGMEWILTCLADIRD
nr:hypothetical protein CFP56_52660 [Quercus suber]